MPNTGCAADDRGRAGYEPSRSPGAPRSRPASSGLDLLARDGSARTRAWRRPTGQGWSAAAAAGENEASSGAAAMIAEHKEVLRAVGDAQTGHQLRQPLTGDAELGGRAPPMAAGANQRRPHE